jgi:hypothetical protein
MRTSSRSPLPILQFAAKIDMLGPPSEVTLAPGGVSRQSFFGLSLLQGSSERCLRDYIDMHVPSVTGMRDADDDE